MKVLGISGSLRSESRNTALLRAAAMALPPAAELELYDGLAEIPPYSEDDQAAAGDPVAVRRLKQAIAGADAVVLRNPGVQPLDPGAAQERSRLGLAPARGQPDAGQAGGDRRRQHRQLRGGLAQAELRKVAGALGARPIDRAGCRGRSTCRSRRPRWRRRRCTEPPTPVRIISSSRPAFWIAATTPSAMSSSCV